MPIKHLFYQNWSMPRLIWDPHTRTQINQIEKVQRRAARYVTNRYHNTSSVTDIYATKFKLAILRNHENTSSHTYQHIRTDKDSYSFYPRTIIQWNLLPIHVHEAVTALAQSVTVLAPGSALCSPVPMFPDFCTLLVD